MIKIKNFILLLFFLSIIPLTSFGQLSLIIEITGLKNNTGQVILEFCNEKEQKISGITQNISDKKCIIIIKNLKPGKYAYKYFHDENKNEKLDQNWIGIPTEGYGFSIVEGAWLPPSFEDTLFAFYKNTTLKCTPKYIKL